MTFFQHLPSSVLQAGLFSLDYYRGPTFVLIGSIISGIIEVYITPERVYRFLPRINLGGSSLGPLSALSFLPVNVELFPVSILSEKKVPSYTAVPFWWQHLSSIPSFSLRPTQPFGNSVKMSLPRPWFPFGRNGSRDLSWFYSDRFDPKEHRKAVHEHDF